ncbi:MAG: TlpA disulfide reductase family protein [Fuerstiella sp.]
MAIRICTYYLLATVLAATAQATDSVQEIRFTGTLSQATSNSDERILRNFETLLLQGSTDFFAVLDDEIDGCPWPESFGTLGKTGSVSPHLIYQFDENTYTLPLPVLKMNLPADINSDSEWTDAGWTFTAESPETIDKISAWKLRARERRGRQQSITVEASSGLLLKADMDVFMGQGEKFRLSIHQTSSKPVAAEASRKNNELQSALLELQSVLQRRPDSQLSELASRQIVLAKERQDNLTALAKDTPLQETVLRIRRDVDTQERRLQQTMAREQQLQDKPAPGFTLNLVSGGTLDSAALKGKVTILHFWNYSEKPLSEPYGQVGYLEFLYNNRKQDGVEVVGVATNNSLQQADQVVAGRRTAKKLAEFMNITYPIGYDNGSLLKAVGDPRRNAGSLPLWIMISKSGNIVHYQSGFYEIDRRDGLKELNELVTREVAK